MLSSFRAVSDAGNVAAQLIAGNERLRDVWRFAVVQMLDDYRSVLRHKGIDAASAMWRDAPEPVGDLRADAAFAALAEHLARHDGWPVPRWASDPAREALPWWFVTELRGMHPRALVESPASFRKRGVCITSDALERV
ncbi:hypothetical protein EV193_10174 [Herbihabitans rhizosphaerae]|uniref:Uncharacterized protein n=1 Tax=Herbihabitans rhizosphaerae TaxID=1872711 RepID=A0A4Q7L3M8_9PSEU|nr:hypothetical protein EV193_10174 [Herbihabitans rhizosphaerae]